MSDDIETRPKDSNADAWHLFLSEYLDARANSPSGLTFMAVQIAEAIDDAERRGETAKLPCGHHVSCLVKSVESTNQFCGFCDIMSQRNDAEMMEAKYQRERNSLRKANAELAKALADSTKDEFSMARRLRTGIVEARRQLAKGRALWNGPCVQCDGVLEAALRADAPTTDDYSANCKKENAGD